MPELPEIFATSAWIGRPLTGYDGEDAEIEGVDCEPHIGDRIESAIDHLNHVGFEEVANLLKCVEYRHTFRQGWSVPNGSTVAHAYHAGSEFSLCGLTSHKPTVMRWGKRCKLCEKAMQKATDPLWKLGYWPSAGMISLSGKTIKPTLAPNQRRVGKVIVEHGERMQPTDEQLAKMEALKHAEPERT